MSELATRHLFDIEFKLGDVNTVGNVPTGHRVIGNLGGGRFEGERLRLAWNREHVQALFSFGKWVIGGTLMSFVAQQFHVIYLGKFLPLAILGVYTVAWNFCVQASKPLTMLSNRVIIPHFASFARTRREQHGDAVGAALGRFLPAALLLRPAGLH